MKSLLHNCGEHIVVGLNTSVYYAVGDAMCELPAASPIVSSTADPSSHGHCNDPLDVQAVAVTVNNMNDTNEIWCAVARNDKSLSLYRVRSNDDTSSKTLRVEQAVVHKTLKRVSTLCFATVYGTTKESHITVVVTGDLAGDATAYALTDAESKPNHETDDDTTGHRRLLLGHTASMLTSVHVVPLNDTGATNDADASGSSSTTQCILTSDRDEKIRVSSFPSTHGIQGFLLGHEAFVSSVAVVASRPGWCVSVGGDHTLRLWDYEACREVTRVTLATANVSGTDAAAEQLEASQTNGVLAPVPTKVSVSPDGVLIVVMADHCLTLECYKIKRENGTIDNKSSNVTLEHVGQFQCAAQPLGMAFVNSSELLIVSRGPTYVQVVQITDNAELTTVSLVSVQEHALYSVRQAALEAGIVAPMSLLERDDSGFLKMQKMNEMRSGATLKPWNNASRKETDKERVKRVRKRRRDDLNSREPEEIEEGSPPETDN